MVRTKEQNHEYYLKNKQKFYEYRDKWRAEHPDARYEEYQNARHRIIKDLRHSRQQLLDLLGSKCSNPKCLVPGGCTERRVLQFDHINGGGHAERKNSSTTQIIKWYLRHPEEAKAKLQILCANCNILKRWEKGEHGNIKYTYKDWVEESEKNDSLTDPI